MPKKIVVVNASPRKDWNTDTLLMEAAKGALYLQGDLTPVLDAIREADGLIIGSPNYLSEMTASFRALYERLIFQNLTYNVENPCCNAHPILGLFIMTSNAPDTMYTGLVENYKNTLTM